MFRNDIGYQAPLFRLDSYFEECSSFPSDNAALLFVMTTGFWLVSRWWGLLWLCFSLLAPAARVYFGLHYPGDIFAGALIGITITIAINNEFVRHRIALPMLIFEKQAPLFLYEVSNSSPLRLLKIYREVAALRSAGRAIVSEAGRPF